MTRSYYYGTSVKFEFLLTDVPANYETNYIRIDVVRPKKMINISTQHHLKMPTGVGQFANLASNYMLERNFINKLHL